MLSRDRFARWLVEVQGQPAEALLDKEKGEYRFEEFLEAVYYCGGFEAVRALPSADKDLTRPISNYFISSSHNTYLSGNQLSSKSSTEAYKNVLIRGCRCIEIDVHNGTPAEESKSPESTSSSTFETIHKRHKSGSTLSSLAAATLEKAEGKYNETKTKIWSKVSNRDKGKDEDEPEERGRTASRDNLGVEEPSQRPQSIGSLRLGEPIVMHGWTLTSRVGFRAVCKTIAEVAFQKSDLPIIVSLEVHADTEQQEVMVDIMKEEWKGLLVDTAHEACNPEERLPNLDELKNKILIKVKKAAEKPADPAVAKPDVAAGATLAPVPSHRNGDSGSEDERGGGKKKLKICESLSNLGIYTHSEHFVSFEAKSASKPPHVFSIGENQIMELHEHKPSEMFAHNRNFFMRAYPSGIRVDSSNLDPSGYWRKGVQMVALNWQKLDEGMMLNEAMFSGEKGWVLKPPGYRSDPSELVEHKTLDLNITVYAGQHIPLPHDQTEKNFHPYVKCELHVEKPEGGPGEPVDGRGKEVEYKQKTAYCTGDHPDFGKEGVLLSFPQITMVVEHLSFVRFKIDDAKYAKDELAAWACIRLDRLQPGYRFVQLFDAKGQATAGLLFIKIEKKLR